MRTAFVSTLSLLNTPRAGVGRMQADIVRLNQEVVTSRMADVGLNLGAQTSRSVTLHIDIQALSAAATNNAQVSSRLEQSQAALDKMRSDADAFLTKIVGGANTVDAPGLAASARSAMTSFINNANASDGRDYLFGGINSGTPPLADYDSGPGAAIDAAFLAKFGFAQDDPQAAGISATAMASFLDNEFADLFSDPAWGNTWSDASDTTLTSRISLTEKASTSASANEPAMRKLAQVYSMVGYLGLSGLSADARETIMNKASGLLGATGKGITELQASLGDTQNQVKDATERLTQQQTILQTRVGTLEGVDPAEAKVRIDTLSTQIEMSYSLTAKLLQMSILNYV